MTKNLNSLGHAAFAFTMATSLMADDFVKVAEPRAIEFVRLLLNDGYKIVYTNFDNTFKQQLTEEHLGQIASEIKKTTGDFVGIEKIEIKKERQIFKTYYVARMVALMKKGKLQVILSFSGDPSGPISGMWLKPMSSNMTLV